MWEAASHPCPVLGTWLGEGGALSVPPAPSWSRSVVPGEGHSDAARAGGSGAAPKSWILGRPLPGEESWSAGPKGASWDRAAKGVWAWAEVEHGLPGAQGLTCSTYLPCSGHVLLPQGCSHPRPGCGYSHGPHPQILTGRGTPPSAHTTGVKQTPSSLGVNVLLQCSPGDCCFLIALMKRL